MRVISCNLRNFASYKQLAFNFNNQGLCLIQGATGSGKSTLCDAIPWLAFGRTAKNGEVGEVLSWPGTSVTSGALHVEVKDAVYVIHRSRGPKAKDNDLYYLEVGVEDGIRRGKDLLDTQKLINNILGMDIDLYLAGAYYHEFSQTAQFFTTTAKNRRTICEQVVDLTLAKNLHIKLSAAWKGLKFELGGINDKIIELEHSLQHLENTQKYESQREAKWNSDHEKTIAYCVRNYDRFEADRKKTITNQCRECGTVLAEPKEVMDTSENPYLSRLAELEVEVNPFAQGTKDYSIEILGKQYALYDVKLELEKLTLGMDDIELLQQVTNDYRSASIANAISNIETHTNKLLSDHFDAEIRVAFTAEDADKLDVSIHKDGNRATYEQLSKGQRCMLKLAFSVSVMEAVQNHHGTHFNQLFFDEALSGMDEILKIKSLRLFETLAIEHESIFLIEHSEELKAMMDKKVTVELVNGNSQIEKT